MQFLSIYFLASILSTAFIIKFCSFQKFSSKIISFSGPTLDCLSIQLKFSFIFFASLQAHFDLDLPTSHFLNKNCLFKLLISIKSLSVTNTFPTLLVDIPIKEKFLRNSHPNAPAPIIKMFKSDNFFCISLPNIAI